MLRTSMLALAATMLLAAGPVLAGDGDPGSRYSSGGAASSNDRHSGRGLGGTDAGSRTARGTSGTTRSTVSSAPGHLW